ncbi:hypothetical protein [Streptomyces flaveolus]|uniref:hypothetical protein n=1 Tax=Streptomyces flaveolus TaxID=67297 RepID=UPI0034002529
MYEHERLPAGVTYAALHRAGPAEGGAARETVGGTDLTGVGTATGGGLGRASRSRPAAAALGGARRADR